MSENTKETVLVVDDNAINLKVIANFLSRANYKVLVADDGYGAIELAQTAKPDIILLDVTMPGIDGYETCARLKNNAQTRKIPVLFLSARSETQDKVRGFQAGGADYITKPYQEPDVLARVTTQLTLSRQKAELEQMIAHRERFMKIAAHDLRNPLAVIIFLAGTESAPGNVFDKIERAGNQMKSIIDDFLSLQIVQKNDAQATFDLGETTCHVLEQQQPSAQNKGITITLEPFPSNLAARGSSNHAHQILTNYTSNAVKYSPLHTRVTMRILDQDTAWRVEVQDQGPGVPLSERSNLFVEFARISTRPTAGESSTRLGLSVVRKLAETLGGKSGASFPESGGSIFWFEIPKA